MSVSVSRHRSHVLSSELPLPPDNVESARRISERLLDVNRGLPQQSGTVVGNDGGLSGFGGGGGGSAPGRGNSGSNGTNQKIEVRSAAASLSINYLYTAVTFILGAMTFITALTWRDSLTKYFQDKHALNAYGPWAGAFIITAVAVIVVVFLANIKHSIKTRYNVTLASEV